MSNIPFAFRCIKNYVRFWTEKVYYESTYVQGIENIPETGTPVLVTCNHQNSLNDALGIMLAINDRKANFIVRADVFSISKGFAKFLNSIGLLPAYRLNYEGSEAIKANASTFQISEKALINGETVVMFPEGGHAEGHWFNIFKGGMAKMAFEAAALDDFKKDIQIVPACNHYSSYYGLRNKMLVRFGKPISVKPYYDLYKEKPYTAMRKLTKEVHDSIEAMVYNVQDKEYYNEIEYLRSGAYGESFAERNQFDTEDFEERFECDKLLLKKLLDSRRREDKYFNVVLSEEGQTLEEIANTQIQERNAAIEKEGLNEVEENRFQKVLNHARELLDDFKSLGICERQFVSKPDKLLVGLEIAALLVLLPLALIGLWPTFLCWIIPKYFSNKAKGDMFEGTFVLAINALLIIPITAILTFAFIAIKLSTLLSLIYVLLFPLIFIFEWNYVKTAKQVLSDLRYFKAEKSGKISEIEKKRLNLFSELDELLTV